MTGPQRPPEAVALPAVQEDRLAFLHAAGSQRDVRPKSEFIVERCRGRSVLDIGCINHSAANAITLGDDWLHRRIKDAAASVTGLDTLAEDAAVLNGRGYDITVADAQDFDLGRTFDVVVAADLIEHLTDIGGFLRSVQRHMTQGSSLILTTPNPFGFEQMMQVLLRGRAVVNAEHTVWLDPGVAFALLQREGLEVSAFQWIDSDPGWRPGSTATRVLHSTGRAVGRLRPMVRPNYALVAKLASV